MEITLYWLAIIFFIFTVGYGLTTALTVGISEFIKSRKKDE